jgi:O-antigen/teichoic acid export membrane protein
VLALPLGIIIIGGLSLSGNLTAASAWAIVVLALGLIPSGFSGTLSAIFRAYEKFEYTAALQIFTAIVKVPLGIALLLIWGVVGLAASALVVNLVTLYILYTLFKRVLFVPHLQKFDWILAQTMLREAFPLLLNGFLINVFFQSDVFLLLPFRGDAEVGYYNAAYKFINGLLIIPSTLTLALFPLFSSYSATAKENLLRAYREAVRILVAIAFPISMGTLFVAYDVIGTVSGSNFLPYTAIALQILIWFLPFSYINGVTQYVLIALNRQRIITLAVIGSVAANIGLNLIFIPFFGYVAASFMTIVSELVLLIPYSFFIKQSLGSSPVLAVSWKPGLAALAMGVTLAALNFGLHLQNFFLTALVGGIVYPVALVLLGGFTKADLSLLQKALHKNKA